MGFWENVTRVVEVGRALPWVVVVFLAAAAAEYVMDPPGRKRLRLAIALLAIGLVGVVAAAGLLTATGGDEHVFAYRLVRDIAVLLCGAATVTLAGVIVFDTVLGAARVRPPGLVKDLIMAAAYLLTGGALIMRYEPNITGLITFSAVMTAVIGFAMQDTLGNIAGGMALQVDRTIGVGDWIRVNEMEGVVKEIRWRQTSIENRDWNTVVIPNSVLMRSPVTVLGRRDGQPVQTRRIINFPIDSAAASPNDVIAAVERALRAEPIPGTAAQPAPVCLLFDMSNGLFTYSVRYWLVDIAANEPTDSLVRARIVAALRRKGIPLAYPAQNLFLHAMDEERDKREAAKFSAARLAALRRVHVFEQTLNDDEERALAERLVIQEFARGEVLTRQGASAEHLYIIARGTAEVRVSGEGNGSLSRAVATLGPGDFFGEMALLTGAMRTATVVATSDMTCYRLDKDPFMDVLKQRPQIAEGISHILAERRVQLDAAKLDLDEQARQKRVASEESSLLATIRSFFTLE